VSAPRTVGGQEWAGLPDLGVPAVRARVDTAAPASSLRADDIELAGGPHGPVVRFIVHRGPASPGGPGEAPRVVEAPLHDLRDVPAGDGRVERRPVIRTRLLLAGLRCPIELSLTSGGDMAVGEGYSMLVGRRALRRRFHVDPARSFVGGGTTIAPPGG
jgi:ribosomal protein S6--L-glutamate ligase